MNEHTEVQLTQLNPYAGESVQDEDAFFIWNADAASLQFITKAKLFAGIGNGGGGGGSATIVGSPFVVRMASDYYSANGGNAKITHIALIGKTDYAVTSTQLGGREFFDDEITYDSEEGSFTLPGFQLEAGQKLRVYVDGVPTDVAVQKYNALADRLTAAEGILIIFKPTALGGAGAAIPWYKDLDKIPAGWQAIADIEGRILLNLDANNPLYKTIGAKLGAKEVTLDLENIPAHAHEEGGESLYNDGGGGTLVGPRIWEQTNIPPGAPPAYRNQLTKKAGGLPDGTTKPISILPEVVVVCYIEYVGL